MISFATGVDVPSVQLALNAAILAREQRARVIAALWRGNAYAWVSRGAWDSALVAFDRAVSAWPSPEAAVDAYGLAVTGAVLGVSPVDEAVRRRPAPASQWRELRTAQLAWFDGLLAYVRGDHDGLARARNTLKVSSAIFVDALQASLAAFATDAAGDRARAARELARLEFDNANLLRPPPLDARHPFLVAVNRLVAARWLRETGGDSEAARLLTWSEATPAAWPGPLNRTFGSIGLVDRAEIAESLGQTDRARSYYSRFLERFDMPVPELVPFVERARDGVQRLRAREHADPRHATALAILSIHAVIAYIDSVCVHLGGRKSTSSDHHSAVALLRSIMGSRLAKTTETALLRVLSEKDRFEYQGYVATLREAERLDRAERLGTWAESVLTSTRRVHR